MTGWHPRWVGLAVESGGSRPLAERASTRCPHAIRVWPAPAPPRRIALDVASGGLPRLAGPALDSICRHAQATAYPLSQPPGVTDLPAGDHHPFPGPPQSALHNATK
jgi:hypothetical protein